jgi:hypothetical protein
MGAYKVIQDIEAEDKLLGPLTLRQFIYAVIVVVSGIVIFKLGTSSAWWLSFIFIPHTILFAFLAAPFGHDQSSEVWLLAKIRFFLKPRRRIWDQSGIKELVTITAPKKVEKVLTKNLSQTEVRSRLEALANTIDSRGWAVKNVNVNLFSQPSYVLNQASSDRLIDPSTLAQDVPAYDISMDEDMLDERSNPTAAYFDQMITVSSQSRKQQIMERMRQPEAAPQQQAPAPDYWFMNQPPAPTQPGYAVFDGSQSVQPGVQQAGGQPAHQAPDEQALLENIRTRKKKKGAGFKHLKTIKPLGDEHGGPANTAAAAPEKPQPAPVTPPPNPAILELANNDDLNVATIARQAEKATKQTGNDEVVISLR